MQSGMGYCHWIIKKDKKLSINIEPEGNTIIVISIDDNGVGRQASYLQKMKQESPMA